MCSFVKILFSLIIAGNKVVDENAAESLMIVRADGDHRVLIADFPLAVFPARQFRTCLGNSYIYRVLYVYYYITDPRASRRFFFNANPLRRTSRANVLVINYSICPFFVVTCLSSSDTSLFLLSFSRRLVADRSNRSVLPVSVGWTRHAALSHRV